jgi:transcriptional regulator with XRE-family HTH domain
MEDRDTFGSRLRLERERRGLALKDIADATKIKASQFAELERGDVSNWPHGIFRRAHLCAYLSAIGLPPQPALAEFLELFPDGPPLDQFDKVEVSEVRDVRQAPQPLPAEHAASQLMDRVWVVCFDLALVCLAASVLASTAGISLWPTLALVGLGYSSLGSVWFAHSIGTFVQYKIRARVHTRREPQATPRPAPRNVHLIASRRASSNFSQGDMHAGRETGQRRASA